MNWDTREYRKNVVAGWIRCLEFKYPQCWDRRANHAMAILEDDESHSIFDRYEMQVEQPGEIIPGGVPNQKRLNWIQRDISKLREELRLDPECRNVLPEPEPETIEVDTLAVKYPHNDFALEIILPAIKHLDNVGLVRVLAEIESESAKA